MALRKATAAAAPWSDLATRLQFLTEGKDIHTAGRRGLRYRTDGPPSAQAELRLFGTRESEVRVVFYRDNHAWCPYCHKVWLQLEEKRVPYRVEKISMNCYGDKKRSFLKKTPRGLLPALEIDSNFYVESSVIMQLIEDTFPEKPLLPPQGSPQAQLASRSMSLERTLFGAWLNWLRGEESVRACRAFEDAMDETDTVLKSCGGPYFLGPEVSLVDLVFASSLERIAASILYYKGLRVKGGRWQHVNVWFDTMELLESYKATQSDFHTHVHDLPPQIGGCIASGTPEQLAAAAEIDGRDGRSWHLPLTPLTAASLEPGSEDEALDRLEAANALIHCHDGILKSSQAGADADAAFRTVAAALLDGAQEVPAEALAGLETSAAVSLRWTRDRICVPRDMSHSAARQLRAHLNWAADLVDPQSSWVGVALSSRDRRDSDPSVFWGSSL